MSDNSLQLRNSNERFDSVEKKKQISPFINQEKKNVL